MTIHPFTRQTEADLVLAILEAGGSRGASHEDFVEAGLARDYIAALRHLVDQRGLRIRTDFTTGQPRWILLASESGVRRAA